MVGELTVTIVGRYKSMELAIAAWDAGTDPAATDSHQLFIEPGINNNRIVLVKVVRAAA